jgi:hypothetical protein
MDTKGTNKTARATQPLISKEDADKEERARRIKMYANAAKKQEPIGYIPRK